MDYLGQFAVQNIETWQADSSIGNTPMALKNSVSMATHSFPVQYVSDFHLTYLYACWIMHEVLIRNIKIERQRWPKKLLIWGGLEPSMLPW